MRVLVTGSRGYRDAERIHDYLMAASPSVVIHGGAKGADAIADTWARAHGIPIERYPADWRRYGRGAGPQRNRLMLVEGQPDLVLAFPLPESKGTWNMVEEARARGIPVVVVEQTGV